MATNIKRRREPVDLRITVELPFDTVWQVLAAVIPDGRHVDVVNTFPGGCSVRVRSWSKTDIGYFEVRWHCVSSGRFELTSTLVQSVLRRSSVIPFRFDVGRPRALGDYREAMSRVRRAFEACTVQTNQPSRRRLHALRVMQVQSTGPVAPGSAA